MLQQLWIPCVTYLRGWFQWAPTLGGECYQYGEKILLSLIVEFQWAPTLGGECYAYKLAKCERDGISFNGHPPLGVNATHGYSRTAPAVHNRFNGHPPLGVNATLLLAVYSTIDDMFQWAPTLGGECYERTLARKPQSG